MSIYMSIILVIRLITHSHKALHASGVLVFGVCCSVCRILSVGEFIAKFGYYK